MKIPYSAKDEQWAAKRPTASPKTHRNGCDARVQYVKTVTFYYPPPILQNTQDMKLFKVSVDQEPNL